MAAARESTPMTGAIYALAARRLHWWTAGLLALQIPAGLFMVRYGEATHGAPPTGVIYDGHKLLGLTILFLAAGRLGYRLVHGAPSPEPSLARWQRLVSHATHWTIYALLLLVPLLGWVAISYYGPFAPFGLPLPVLVAANGDKATRFFALHGYAAYALIILIGMHVGAALMHYFMRKDGVMARMLLRAGSRA
jgi:cytochrome b561